MKKQSGFTLIELLLVIAIIAILAAIIFVAVDPARRLAEARNAERWSSVNTILNAVLKYTVDNRGVLPTSLDSDANTVQIIGEGGVACGAVTCVNDNSDSHSVAAASCFVSDFDTVLVDYLSAVPRDSKDGTVNDTKYYINKTSGGRLVVGSCREETVGGSTPTIEVSR